jgi:hypothetical protein
MNQDTARTSPPPEEIRTMRQFLARVVRTGISEIRLTGDPATDTNADLVKEASPGPGGDWTRPERIAKLDPLEAMAIDSMIDPENPHLWNPAEAAQRFAAFLAGRVPLYQ